MTQFASLRPARRRGFTLVELLVVIAIIGILLVFFCQPFRRRARRRVECSARTISSSFRSPYKTITT
jgi:prepilin-type N-terminal cleavage/methylation domain-containing protein